MTSTPEVSIIITAWNRAYTIERAVRSALDQSFQDFEIVLVDDASTDNLAEVVDAKAWPKLRFVRNPTNRGIAGAKNVGIENARGRYIAFLDSDDEWLPRKLDIQLSALQSRVHEMPLSFTAFHIVRSNGHRVLRRPHRYGGWLEASLLGEMFALGSTLLAHRSCFERVGLLDESIRRMEDRDWILKYFDHWNDLVMVDEPLSLISNSGWPPSKLVRDSMAVIYDRNRERVAGHGARATRMFRSGMDFEIATMEYRNNEIGRALSRMAWAVGRNPSYLYYVGVRAFRKLASRDLI
jgi:glycosyltransferase involved in cell wall biosynthesis